MAGLVLLGLAGFLILASDAPRPEIAEWCLGDQIQARMTESEVRAILGRPRGGWKKGEVMLLSFGGCVPFCPEDLGEDCRVWVGEKEAVIVNVKEGVVVDTE
jgi:hypothetical protein